MKTNENQKSTREYKVYIHRLKTWVEVNEEQYHAYYRDIWATRKRAQAHGQCMCPKSKTWMGFTVVPFGQGFKDMSPPTKELMKLVLEERIAHGGHPVLRWMMDNIFIRTDPAGNIKPDKEKSTEKIDGAVATIMALDRAIRCGNENGASVYDDRGILFI